jgi:hypothetical protein
MLRCAIRRAGARERPWTASAETMAQIEAAARGYKAMDAATDGGTRTGARVQWRDALSRGSGQRGNRGCRAERDETSAPRHERALQAPRLAVIKLLG